MTHEFPNHTLALDQIYENQYKVEVFNQSGELLHIVLYAAHWRKGPPEQWDEAQWDSLLADALADMERRGAVKA